jgi:wobble nucleotide-excising tRNase
MDFINKIKSIKKFGVFNDFDWDGIVRDDHNNKVVFGNINIIYGRNYSGKTTLSRIFRILETGYIQDSYDNPNFEILLNNKSSITQNNFKSCTLNVRVFNEDFIRSNLRFLVDPDGEIVPFAILGSDNTIIEKEISKLLDEIGSDILSHETGLHKKLLDYNNLAEIEKNEYNTAKDALEKKLIDKATNKEYGIKYQFIKFGDQNYTVKKLKEDYQIVKSSSYLHLTSDQKIEYEQIIKEQAKENVPTIPVQQLMIDEYCMNAIQLLSKQIGTSNKLTELLRDAALNDWVKQGLNLHKDRNLCAFCGNQINDERWSLIHQHFDQESQTLERDIDNLIKKIENHIYELKIILMNIDKTKFYLNFHKQIDFFSQSYKHELDKYSKSLSSILEQLNKRKNEITVSFSFTSPQYETDKLTSLINDFNTIIKQNNDYGSKQLESKKTAQKALRLQEVVDYYNQIDYETEIRRIKEKKDKYDELLEQLELSKKTFNSKQEELQIKYRLLNDEEEGARRVNKYLKDNFGHNSITLEAQKPSTPEKHIKFNIMRHGKPAFNLSVGECSLISFCYFVARLDDIYTCGKKPVIWIDDPISSLDSNHVFFVYSLILSQIINNNKFSQIFISTHNLDFLKYLNRLNGEGFEKRFFVINRTGDKSIIEVMPNYLKVYATEYNYLFSKILECSQIEIINDNNHELIYNFGNIARRFFEIHLYFKYPDNSKNKLQRFFANDTVAAELINRFYNETSHGSLERAQRIGEIPEAIPTAKIIIEKLKQDSEQFEALLRSIGKQSD